MPGAGALLAPEWVPWSVRLADYQASQEALRLAGLETDGSLDTDGDALEVDDEDLEDELDDDELDDEELDDEDNLHDADIDGVDIDLEGDVLAAPDGEVDETDEAEPDSDDGSPHPPLEAARAETALEDDQHDEGDHPDD